MFASLMKVVRSAAVVTSVVASGIFVVSSVAALFRGVWFGWPQPNLGFRGVKGLFSNS